MDDLLQTVKREIALDCEKGSTLAQVWGYVERAQQELCQQHGIDGAAAACTADSALRRYVWPLLVQQRELIFVCNGVTLYAGASPESAASAAAQRFLALDAAGVEARYPELFVRASQPAIYRELFGREEGNERVTASSNAYKFLVELARAREKGITQYRLAKDLGVDPRSAFHFVSVLDTYGLIVKYVTFDNGNNTKLLVLRRFTKETPGGSGGGGDDESALLASADNGGAAEHGSGETTRLVRFRVRLRISEILQAAEGGLMVETDLVDALGLDVCKDSHIKYFHRVLRDLNANGYVETVRVLLPDRLQPSDSAAAAADAADTADTASEATRGRRKRQRTRKTAPEGYSYRRCVRFIKPYVEHITQRASQGIPLRAKAGIADGGPHDDAMADDNSGSDDDGDDDGAVSSDNGIDAGSVKEKHAIMDLLSKPQVAVGMLAALPVDLQVLRIIALAGRGGVISRSVQFLLGMDTRKTNRVLAILAETPVFSPDGSVPGLLTPEEDKERNRQQLGEMLVFHIDESMGREHRKRYFVNPLAQPLIDRLTADYADDDEEDGADDGAGDGVDDETSAAGAAVGAISSNNGDGDGVGDIATDEVVHAEPALADATDAVYRAIAAGCGTIEEVYDEAKSRRAQLGCVIRERAVLQMLAHEPVFAITQRTAHLCDRVCKLFLEIHANSAVLTPAVVAATQKHRLDKRTLIRTVDGLVDRGLIWSQVTMMTPEELQPRDPKFARIVIARSVDPGGTLVSTFVSQMRDRRTVNAQTYPTAPRKMACPVAVPRTEGAEARDREIQQRAKRARRAAGAMNASLTKRARLMMDEAKQLRDAGSGWAQILRRLHHPPRRVGRMVDLLTYLIENLPGKVDNTYVFANCAFRAEFIFLRLPLELFIELCGGVKHFSPLVPYIRDGAAALDPDVDAGPAGEPALDEIRARLAEPVERLPRTLLRRLRSILVRSRLHIQHILAALQALQLIRPIRSAKDIVAMPAPPDARDAFRRIYVDNPKLLCFGYQLVGKARLLTREGYSLVENAFQHNTPVIADLTGCYLNSDVYDLFAPLGLFRYLGDLEASAREIGKGLGSGHALHGIGDAHCWKRPIVLRATQTQVLDRFVNWETSATPLDSLDRLQEAAQQAETTLDEARRYFQHAHVMASQAANRRANDVKRHIRIRERVTQARAAAAAARRLRRRQERQERQGQPRRQPWNEDENNLITVCYVVLQHHARMHRHPFFLSAIIDMFPGRAHTTNPGEAIRQHWARMRRDPEWRERGENMRRVWTYAFRDAVDSGQLVDSPDLHAFDARAAVDYYIRLLRQTRLESLLEKYADAIAADSEKEQGRLSAFGFGWPSRRAWRHTSVPYVAQAMRTKTAETDRLPATMRGGQGGYTVSRHGAKWYDMPQPEFGEDAYKDGLRPSRRRDLTYATMLTTHRGLRSLADYSCPVTTHLSSQPGSASAFETVAYEADPPPHPDNMSVARPLERSIDGAALASRIAALALGTHIDDDDSDAPAIACCGEQGHSDSTRYAEIACLQTAIVNLTLTPDDEYSVDTGHRLLAQKKDAATKAFAVLGRNMVVSRLRGMASATGLGPRSGEATADGSAAHVPLQAAATHETTGMTRIRTRAAKPTQPARPDGPGGDADDDAMDVDAETAPRESDGGAQPAGRAEGVAEERRVPGRGFSVSDKFLGAITSSLAPDFFSVDCAAVRARTQLSAPLSTAEFGYLCSLVGQGRLWLRPAYEPEHIARLGALAGFRRQETVDAIEFGVCAVAAAAGDAEAADSEDLPDPEDEAADAVGLEPEPLAVALRLAAGVVHALGPVGASAHELARLFSLLDRGSSSSYRSALDQVPQPVAEALAAEARVATLLRVLALRECAFAVGSSDVRYVSAATYHRHWVLTAGDAELAPRLGQNLSGTTNRTFTWGLLTALLGRIVSNPGISLATLARRYFAPYIPRFELLHYLRVLVDLAIVDAETVPVPGPDDPRYPLHTTYYAPAPGYHRRLDRIARCSAVAEIQSVI